MKIPSKVTEKFNTIDFIEELNEIFKDKALGFDAIYPPNKTWLFVAIYEMEPSNSIFKNPIFDELRDVPKKSLFDSFLFPFQP